MRLKYLVTFLLASAACGSLPALPSFLGGHSNHSSSSTTTTTTTEETHASVNGETVATSDAPEPRHAHAHAHARSDRKGYGATCQRNDECVSERGGCYKGYGGEVGYCTSSCDDDFQCPDFWECQRPAGLNTPSKICLQPKD